MPKADQSQPRQRFALFTDENTHRIFTAYARQQGKTVVGAFREVISRDPRVKRFLSKNTHLTAQVGK